jgi:predicted ATPase/class 3 adenylate cyclase/DNA-binding CsgD family transcriptional regulator
MAESERIVSDLSEFRARMGDQAEPTPPAAEAVRRSLPTGTITFLLTDIEGSTRGWEEHGSAMATAVRRHYEILDAAVTRAGGVRPIEQGEGDSLVAAFPRASDAVLAALDAQRALLDEDWPGGSRVSVRIALHTGEAQIRDERYYTGPSIIRCARLRSLAYGGQVLISNSTADLLVDGLPEGASLRPLGVHRLKDLREAERVYQLVHPALEESFPPLRSLDALPNNLPTQLTSFVGRARELSEIAAQLAEHRLVTLTGAGGCGKTRLAAQLAGELIDSYPDGVWWVDFAPLSDPDAVAPAVMVVMGLRDNRGLEPLDRITGYLAEQRVLLLLDNCEHVLAPAARLCDGILRVCPGTKVLATSREPLGVLGEVGWKVPPLSLPDNLAAASAEDLLASEAVRLFVERATASRPSFVLDSAGAPTVAALCSRLDGIPLAIELAAARVRSLSPERILDALSDRFRLLTGGARTALPRQQTLQASVEWSHDLLSEAERILLRRLAVFAGGFTLDAAEIVAAGAPLEDWEIVTLLSGLVDRSLVVFEGDRYRLLQTIADFARAKLFAAGEAAAVRDLHSQRFLDWAETVSAELERNPQPAVLERLEADHDNLRAGLGWLIEREDHQRALRLVYALGFFWTTHGHYTEGRDWHQRVLAAAPPEPSLERARALWSLGHLCFWGMALAHGYGLAQFEEAGVIARDLGDDSLLARILVEQAFMSTWVSPDATTPQIFEDGIEMARRTGDEWAVACGRWMMAFYWSFAMGRPAEAAAATQELAAIAARTGSPYWTGWGEVAVGIGAWQQGRLEEARRSLEHALACGQELDEPKLELYAAIWLSNLQLSTGDFEAAATIATYAGERQKRSLDCAEDWVFGRLVLAALAQGDLAEARRVFASFGEMYVRYQIPFVTYEHAMLRGRMALQESDLDSAGSAFDEAADMATSISNPWALAEIHNLYGCLHRSADDLGAAEDSQHQALALCVKHGFSGAATEVLEVLASVVAAGESYAEAIRVFGAAATLRERTGQARRPVDQPAYDADLATLRSAVGDDQFTAAWKEGAALSLEEVWAYASRARGERKRPSHGWESLTPTELEVVALAAAGLSNADIGARMFISPNTAKTHLAHIYAKLGVANRAALAAEHSLRRGQASDGRS